MGCGVQKGTVLLAGVERPGSLDQGLTSKAWGYERLIDLVISKNYFRFKKFMIYAPDAKSGS